MTSNLYKEQVLLETLAHERAVVKLNNAISSGSTEGAGSRCIKSLVMPLFFAELKKWYKSKERTKGALKTYLNETKLTMDQVVYCTVDVTLSMTIKGIQRGVPCQVTKMSYHLSKTLNRLEKEQRLKDKLVENVEKKYGEALVKKMFKSALSSHQLDKTYKKYLGEDEECSTIQAKASLQLIEDFISQEFPIGTNKTNVVLFNTRKQSVGRSHKKKYRVLEPSSALLNFTTGMDAQELAGAHQKEPMVHKPTPWEHGDRCGGYLTPTQAGSTPLILGNFRLKTVDISRLASQELLNTLNKLQERPWRINEKLFTIIKHLKENTDRLGIYVDLDDYDDETFKLGKTLNGKVQRANHFKQRSNRREEILGENGKFLSMSRQLTQANRFKKYDQIFYPHVFDTRGRVYPVGCDLNPQSDKLGLSMLELGTAEELTEEGLFWWMVHGANCFGIDKELFAVRVQWVLDNHENIIAIGEEPLQTINTWFECDDPFNFVAWCIDYAEAHKLEDPTKYKSRICCRFDATCSGLQHYSLLLRDSVGATATNVIGDKRNDIYISVAENARANAQVQIKACEDRSKKQWMRALSKEDSINRKLVKKPTMTKPYGVTGYGVTDSVYASVRTKDIKFIEPITRGEVDTKRRNERIKWLAELVEESINQTVKSANFGMKYLQAVEDAFKEYRKQEGNELAHIKYVSPAGFTFHNLAHNANIKRIETLCGVQKVRRSADIGFTDFSKVKNGKTRSAIAPNFIHCLDGAHLMATWNSFLEKHPEAGAGSIHDSFGTHAKFVPSLLSSLKKELVVQYSVDRLKDLEDQILVQYPDIKPLMPLRPTMGDLNINDVLDAKYPFS